MIEEVADAGIRGEFPKQRDVKVTTQRESGEIVREENAQPYLRHSVSKRRLRGDFTLKSPRIIPRGIAKVLVQQSSRENTAQNAREGGTQRDVRARLIKGKGKSFFCFRLCPCICVAASGLCVWMHQFAQHSINDAAPQFLH